MKVCAGADKQIEDMFAIVGCLAAVSCLGKSAKSIALGKMG